MLSSLAEVMKAVVQVVFLVHPATRQAGNEGASTLSMRSDITRGFASEGPGPLWEGCAGLVYERNLTKSRNHLVGTEILLLSLNVCQAIGF